MSRRRTYREEDGQRVEGTWRPIFTRNAGSYYLSDLVSYADGAIDCGTGGLTDVNGLRDKLRSGEVATALEEGAWASAYDLANWRFADPLPSIDADMLLGEVVDEIERLNDRPDSTERCLVALRAYLEAPTEDRRRALREAYLAIPEHRRCYALGDMDRQDQPLRVLVTDLGEPLTAWPHDVVTAQTRSEALEYFAEWVEDDAPTPERVPADGPAQALTATATVTLNVTYYMHGFPAEPGIKALQNNFPAQITVGGREYPTVGHAYWALSTTDAQAHDEIALAARVYDAQKLAEQAPRRPGWPDARLAVMTALLRAKYTQHPRLAETLLGTGDARIIYSDYDSAYWVAVGSAGAAGTNWVGRLLELIRSELAAAEAGIAAL